MLVSDKIEVEFFIPLTDNAPSPKKVKMGDMIASTQTIRITDLINPAVFPSGIIAVRMADSNTTPINDNKYSLKTMPPTRKPST